MITFTYENGGVTVSLVQDPTGYLRIIIEPLEGDPAEVAIPNGNPLSIFASVLNQCNQL